LLAAELHLGLSSISVERNVANFHSHVLENDVRLLLQVFLDRLLNRRFGMNSDQPVAGG
jgi:hypothetical protein